MKKAASLGGWEIYLNPTVSPSTSMCTALLIQGRREGWTAKSYQRVADCLEESNPLEAMRWLEFARGRR